MPSLQTTVRIACVAFLTAALSGCDNSAKLRQDVATLQARLDDAHHRIDSLSTRLSANTARTEAAFHKVFPPTKAQLDSAKKVVQLAEAAKAKAARPAPPRLAPVVKRAAPSRSGYSGQCQATTQKGYQCSRNARDGSRYCWQHGG